ncbi:hypothetical protein ARMSODRAFT_980807 [Armillaria solidipes]|uniref:Ribonuclease H1 N-terminal domain-containing protein n=1 Tax=Armillaria solidipes TaxID=1076256 RepID=A0A2H3BCP0_9AGAR|nr:hypothetical protein ARMSODRAFT_980807 [Armillaria solidipes]
MSSQSKDAHAVDVLSPSSTACTTEAGSALETSEPTSPVPPPPSSANSNLDKDEDSDIEMVLHSATMVATEGDAIRALTTPHDDTPWVAGKKFYVVPPQPLVTTNVLQSKTWYAVYKGLWVGVVTSLNTANSATLGVSNCSQKGFKNQLDAVNAFNEALDEKEICDCINSSSCNMKFSRDSSHSSMANTHLNRIDNGNTSDDSLKITLLSNSSSDSSNLEIWMSAEEGSDNSDPDHSVPASGNHTPLVQSDVPLDPPPLYEAIAHLNLHENAVEQASHSHDETLYMVQSATYTGMTTDWSHASQLVLEQQGQVQTIIPWQQHPLVHGHKTYVVFFGWQPGIFHTWDACEAQTSGISQRVFTMYRSHTDAHAAYEYAEVRGWTGCINRHGITFHQRREMNIPKPIDFLHASEEAFDTPLNLSQDRPCCLEVSINAIGIRRNSHESFESLEVAREKFQSALDQPGHVVFLHANQYRCDGDVYPPTVPIHIFLQLLRLVLAEQADTMYHKPGLVLQYAWYISLVLAQV